MFNAFGEFGFAELLARRFRTTGGSSAPSLAPEVFATFPLEVDRPEWGWLKGELAHAAVVSEAAVAAQFTKVQLFNPPGSGIIAVLKQFSVISTSSNVALNRTPEGYVPTLVNESQGGALDYRVVMPAALRSSVCRTFRGNEAAGTAGARQLWLRGGVNPADVSIPVILLPGDTLEWQQQTVNLTLSVALWWTERPAQPGELG